MALGASACQPIFSQHPSKRRCSKEHPYRSVAFSTAASRAAAFFSYAAPIGAGVPAATFGSRPQTVFCADCSPQSSTVPLDHFFARRADSAESGWTGCFVTAPYSINVRTLASTSSTRFAGNDSEYSRPRSL